MAYGHSEAIEDLLQIPVVSGDLDAIAEEGDPLRLMGTLQTIERAIVGQSREGTAQILLRPSVESAFASEVGPLSKQNQGQHFAGTKRGGTSGLERWCGHMRLAKGVHDAIQCGEEVLDGDHEYAPFFGENDAYSTAIRTSLPPF